MCVCVCVCVCVFFGFVVAKFLKFFLGKIWPDLSIDWVLASNQKCETILNFVTFIAKFG